MSDNEKNEQKNTAVVSAANNCYTSEELKKWWVAECPKCGRTGLSRDAAGGGQIADTGDYGDVICPVCIEKDDYILVDNIE